MDTGPDGPTIVKVYKCYFCSKYIATEPQVILTHVQLHVEYMGKDADNRYRCPVEVCPLQHPTPEGLAEHLLKGHATKRKAKTDSAAYQRALRFGIRTKEKLIQITEERGEQDGNLLQPRRRALDNRGRNLAGRAVNAINAI